MEKILIDQSLFDFDDDVEEFAASIGKITGGKAKVTTLYALEVEDPKMAQAVKCFLGTLRNLKTPAPVEPAPKEVKEKKEKPVKKPRKAKTAKEPDKKHRQDTRYEVLTGPQIGRQFTGATLGLLLKTGKLTAGTHLRHAVKGEMVVTGIWPEQQLRPVSDWKPVAEFVEGPMPEAIPDPATVTQ
jgi:hypothetical protein